MSALRWLLCAVRLHCPPPGMKDELCLYWLCTRCHTRVPGALGMRR